MRAFETALDDDSIGRMVNPFRVEAEVWESLLVFVEERADAGMSVPDFARGHDLVARMCKRRYTAVEVVSVLGLHVLEYRCFAPLPSVRFDGGRIT